MKKIEFTKKFNGEEKNVELSCLSDLNTVFFLNVGGKHCGILNKYNGQWIGCINEKSGVSAEDIPFFW